MVPLRRFSHPYDFSEVLDGPKDRKPLSRDEKKSKRSKRKTARASRKKNRK